MSAMQRDLPATQSERSLIASHITNEPSLSAAAALTVYGEGLKSNRDEKSIHDATEGDVGHVFPTQETSMRMLAHVT